MLGRTAIMALGAIFAATGAEASVTLQFGNTPLSSSGTASGFVTLSDDLVTVLNWSITTTAGRYIGGPGAAYAAPGAVYSTLTSAASTDFVRTSGQIQYSFATTVSSFMLGGFLSGDTFSFGSISETKNSGDYPIRVANLQPNQVTVTRAATSPVPEAATWAMMVIGFGALGASMRRRQQANVTFA